MKRAVLLALLLAGCGQGDPCATSYCHPGANQIAIDGDTFRTADGRRYRLARIDAPEMPGHCRRGRRCVEGDPYAAKQALQWFLDDDNLVCKPVGTDYYRRTLVECLDGGRSVNDSLIELGFAEVYRR
jgi:micrococcal nuclease